MVQITECKHKQWWHEFMCDEEQMNSYVEIYNLGMYKNKKEI